ncbi:MAG: iron hydrogenase [Alphaproteobacteria bacterium]|nr:iron hydrogenase [Alphaproteobacteria bacterium]
MLKKGPLTFIEIEKLEPLKKALNTDKKDIVDEICKSKMRGKGGGGFPTGMKWKNAYDAVSQTKYVLCNADEGEPGTFKDREVLETTPNLLFEGMTICGYTIGAKKGYLYLRGEYEYMKDKLNSVLQERRDKNLLGENILGSGLNFDIEIRMGAGAYICGEQSALVESIEGKPGFPREKFPLLTEEGLWGKPTCVNNVESFCWCSTIILKSADWFLEQGSECSTGPKLYSISGDIPVEQKGVYEYRCGCKPSELFDAIGIDRSNVQAVQISGAAGECITVDELDNRIMGYEDIFSGGSIMVFDKSRDMLEILQNFMEFFVHESCGQCSVCPLGNVKLLAAVKAIRAGNMTQERMNDVKDMIIMMKDQNLNRCGLGQTSPNPFESILKNFN